ncbi:MAG: hypothetical protein QF654_13580 [Alphaproteobacteria bacterium]|jgi:hypothetical protein|nr:hypothetical protein [Alphaproteobacteria bacterium]
MEEKLEISYVPADELSDEDLTARNISREDYIAMRAARIEREKSAPRVGEPAPDFEIEQLTEDGKRSGGTFRLSSTRGRPVALILGSYT